MEQNYDRPKALEQQQKRRQHQECIRTLRQRQFEEEEHRWLYEAALTRRLEAEAALKRLESEEDRHEEETVQVRGPDGRISRINLDNPSKQTAAVPRSAYDEARISGEPNYVFRLALLCFLLATTRLVSSQPTDD
jgi:hypothetical protein